MRRKKYCASCGHRMDEASIDKEHCSYVCRYLIKQGWQNIVKLKNNQNVSKSRVN